MTITIPRSYIIFLPALIRQLGGSSSGYERQRPKIKGPWHLALKFEGVGAVSLCKHACVNKIHGIWFLITYTELMKDKESNDVCKECKEFLI